MGFDLAQLLAMRNGQNQTADYQAMSSPHQPYSLETSALAGNETNKTHDPLSDIVQEFLGLIDTSVLDSVIPGGSMLMGIVPGMLASFDIASLPKEQRAEIATSIDTVINLLQRLGDIIKA
jgi:hypothetical protein